MKRITALALALVLCFSLCACGGDTEKLELYEKYEDLIDYMEDGDYQNALSWVMTKAQSKQNNQDNEDGPGLSGKQETYDRLCRELETLEEHLANGWDYWYSYLPEGSEEYVSLYGSEAYLQLRQELLNLDGYKDSQELAARFTVVEDVLLSVTRTYTDALGNEHQDTMAHYAYNAQGQICSGPAPEEVSYLAYLITPSWEYDDNGRLVCLKEVSGDTVEAVLNIFYNADGTTDRTEYKNASGGTYSYQYVYEDGRLVQRNRTDGYDTYIQTYTYNDAGQLIKTEEQNAQQNSWYYVDTAIYTYDAAGNVASKRESEFEFVDGVLDSENYIRQYTYTYDDDGNLLTALETDQGSLNAAGEQTETDLYFPMTHTYNYGNYCVYTPAS